MWKSIAYANVTGMMERTKTKGRDTLDLQHRLEAAQVIAQSAGKVALGYFRQQIDVSSKSDQSPVTIADQETERAIRRALTQNFPGEPVFGEEFGQTGDGNDLWIVDPIDGTRSFITGLPLFGLLMGYQNNGVPALGVIHMPALGETYAGGNGIGATFNATPIQASDCTTLETARLFLNEADKLASQNRPVFERLIASGGLRRMSADCYPHALVASGHADAVVDFDLQPYDYLPVSAVVTAAGGVMTDWDGHPLTMESDGRTLTAATPALHAELVACIRAADEP